MIEDRLKAAARKVVDKFSTGEHLLREIVSTSYDTTTGENIYVYNDIPLPMAQSSLEILKVDNTEFVNTRLRFYAVGEDVTAEPKQGWLIVTPSGDIHEIDQIRVDQYKAAYTFYVYKQPWQP